MGKQGLSGIVKNASEALKKHSPEILTGIGIAGMIGATIMAVRATPKALRLIERAEVEKSLALGQGSEGLDGGLAPIEIVKTTWTCYIPAAVTSVVSVVCLIGASSVNHRRNAALATAYTLSESALKSYKGKVVETIGEKKEQSIRDAVVKDEIDKNPVTNREVILTEKGSTLCYDPVSGRYFKSDIEKIRKSENDLNRQMRDELYISLNDFYYEIGLPEIQIGNDIGWHIDNGYIDIAFGSQLASDGTPCIVLCYHVAPRYNYICA
ncbi:hypothetical protein FACS189499_04830 [Clostridia bacterium]|nr:hypothetical protein FACS189499_04830 [Clostridia bacterium]